MRGFLYSGQGRIFFSFFLLERRVFGRIRVIYGIMTGGLEGKRFQGVADFFCAPLGEKGWLWIWIGRSLCWPDGFLERSLS